MYDNISNMMLYLYPQYVTLFWSGQFLYFNSKYAPARFRTYQATNYMYKFLIIPIKHNHPYKINYIM